MYKLRQHRIKFYRSCTTIPVNKSASNGLLISGNIVVSFSRIWLVRQQIWWDMRDVWTSSTMFLSFSLMKLFHIDLYDHQTNFYDVEKTLNSNFVRHHRHYCRPELLSTYCAFIFVKSYFSRLNTRSTSEKSTTDLQTASFFQRRRKYYYYCNIAAASSGLQKLSGGRLSEFITQDTNKSFRASGSEENFTTIVMVSSTIEDRRSWSTFYSTQQFYSRNWIIIREKVINIQHEYCSGKACRHNILHHYSHLTSIIKLRNHVN